MSANEDQKQAQRSRSEERTATSEAVLLSSAEQSSAPEPTRLQNISSRGARVMTQQIWPPGSLVVIRRLGNGSWAKARVVYWRSFSNSRFAIGLELLAKTGEWLTSVVPE